MLTLSNVKNTEYRIKKQYQKNLILKKIILSKLKQTQTSNINTTKDISKNLVRVTHLRDAYLKQFKKKTFFKGLESKRNQVYIPMFFMDLLKQGLIRRGRKNIIEKVLSKISLTHIKTKINPKKLWSNYEDILLNLLRFVRLKERKTRRAKRYKIDILKKSFRAKKGMLDVLKNLKRSTTKEVIKQTNNIVEELKKRSNKAIESRNEYLKTAWKATPFKWRKKIIFRKKNEKTKFTTRKNHKIKIKKIYKFNPKFKSKTRKKY